MARAGVYVPQSSRIEHEFGILNRHVRDTSPFAAYSENGAQLPQHACSQSNESVPIKSGPHVDS